MRRRGAGAGGAARDDAPRAAGGGGAPGAGRAAALQRPAPARRGAAGYFLSASPPFGIVFSGVGAWVVSPFFLIKWMGGHV
jgi:hypothetical protein